MNDASDIAECLTLEQYDFDVVSIENADATRAGILEELGKAAYGSEQGQTLLFYFAGHGAVVGHTGHLVTHDATRFDPGLSLSQLSDIMEAAALNFENVVTVLDCCHAGSAPIFNNGRNLRASDLEREVRVVNHSRSILGACTADDTAKEIGTPSKGVFTSALVQGLLGDAVDYDGNVSLLQLHEYISRAIDSSYQTPVFKGDLTGTVILGQGFEPRKGAHIPSSERAHLVSRAQGLLDEYHQLQHREMNSVAARIEGGSRRCAVELEHVVRWFEDTQAGLPDLIRDSDWKRMQQLLVNAQQRLSEVVQGELTSFGRLERQIGQGGFGQVWEVVAEDGSSSALKIFHSGELQDQVKVTRFRNGFQNMSKLTHPNIVSVRGITLAPLAFVMQYIPGPDLRDFYIDRSSVELMVKLVIDISETLVHAHHKKVRHRDIKPENIIILEDLDGRLTPYLTDFDLAYHETNRTITTNLGVGGVINYAAPEQLHEPNTAAAREITVDVFSLGQLMFYVFVSKDPSSESQSHNIAELKRNLTEWTDERAAQIIVDLYTDCTKRNPRERPSTVEDVLKELSLALGYIQDTSGTDKILVANFCQRVAYMYAGLGNFESHFDGDSASMQSRSGQIGIYLRMRDSNKSEECNVELRLVAEERLGLTDISSSANARTALNHRLDKVTRRFPKATRRNGKQGQYEVFVDLTSVPLNIEGAARVRDLISDAVGAIER